ncbi:methyltransferase domain-containing protein [Roseococcus sp. SYP-B2431]|uniref:methyltransferase domain-containing protein n=1 Tax=Roseococcus sp. SYP-B2431 TaxID=2496640 RepID=UPI00103BC32B|nr:methyltransferase domain-containing protein [Roseococcus sp. SYP-B2431]TCH96174.1 methyltransferase domain-containing protein [Roseococcus sp. SYP-B2431]
MSAEVHGLTEFYAGPLGRAAERMIGARIAYLWPDAGRRDLLGLGWAAPYMNLWSGHGRRILVTPQSAALNGAAAGTALAEDARLPLPDTCLDRILLVHALETSDAASGLLRECWRVLRHDGRLLVVVPNRLGVWAHFDHTPFGQGRPYSRGQVSRLLEQRLFRVARREAALFVPPFPWRVLLGGAGLWDRMGRRLVRRLAGVMLIEAEKDLLAAVPVSGAPARRRVTAPLPSNYAVSVFGPGSQRPAASSRARA